MTIKIIPLVCQLDSAAHDAAMIIARMIFPDDMEKRSNLLAAILAASWEGDMLNQGASFIPAALAECSRQGSAFMYDNKEEIKKRLNYGQLAGRNMLDFTFMQSYREKIVSIAPARAKNKGLMPSHLKLQKILHAEFKNYENENPEMRLAPYSESVQKAAWKIMRPVAHFWAASMLFQEINFGSDCDKEDHKARLLRSFLFLAKGFINQCDNIIPHSGRHELRGQPIFDKQQAYWVHSDIEEWLVEPPIIEIPDNLIKSINERLQALK